MNQQVMPIGLALHPLRERLYAELHSRPFHVITSPARITQIAVLANEQQKRQQYQHLCELCRLLDHPAPEDDIFIELQLGMLKVRRERHMEFASYTFVNCDVTEQDNPFATTGISSLPQGWLDRMPGLVVAAYHVAVEDGTAQRGGRLLPKVSSYLDGLRMVGRRSDGAANVLMLPKVKGYFDNMRLVGSSPQNGDARVWTTFQLHEDGFGRFLVYNHKMSDSQLGRLVQRLMEIETYRLMALLALPVARGFSPTLSEMDTSLAKITHELADEGAGQDEQALLGRLTDMAAQVEACRAESTFRFSATQAYHQLVITRLEELREDEVSGHLTISEFMTRRLTPAVRTCVTVAERLEDLSRRIDRVSDMMRTRVELSIQAQNKDLLESMDRRSQIQLMMQHTVEGLSVAAISYYAVGLVKYLMEALYGAGIEFDKSLALGISVPVVVMLVWFATRRIHKHFLKLAQGKIDDKASDKP